MSRRLKELEDYNAAGAKDQDQLNSTAKPPSRRSSLRVGRQKAVGGQEVTPSPRQGSAAKETNATANKLIYDEEDSDDDDDDDDDDDSACSELGDAQKNMLVSKTAAPAKKQRMSQDPKDSEEDSDGDDSIVIVCPPGKSSKRTTRASAKTAKGTKGTAKSKPAKAKGSVAKKKPAKAKGPAVKKKSAKAKRSVRDPSKRIERKRRDMWNPQATTEDGAGSLCGYCKVPILVLDVPFFCSYCTTEPYCKPECASRNWDTHKKNCPAYQEKKRNGTLESNNKDSICVCSCGCGCVSTDQFKCPECDKEFVQKRCLADHMSKEHSKEQEEYWKKKMAEVKRATAKENIKTGKGKIVFDLLSSGKTYSDVELGNAIGYDHTVDGFRAILRPLKTLGYIEYITKDGAKACRMLDSMFPFGRPNEEEKTAEEEKTTEEGKTEETTAAEHLYI